VNNNPAITATTAKRKLAAQAAKDTSKQVKQNREGKRANNSMMPSLHVRLSFGCAVVVVVVAL
jgi:hypothetical protein